MNNSVTKIANDTTVDTITSVESYPFATVSFTLAAATYNAQQILLYFTGLENYGFIIVDNSIYTTAGGSARNSFGVWSPNIIYSCSIVSDNVYWYIDSILVDTLGSAPPVVNYQLYMTQYSIGDSYTNITFGGTTVAPPSNSIVYTNVPANNYDINIIGSPNLMIAGGYFNHGYYSGNSPLFYSIDGITWRNVSYSATNTLLDAADIYGIAYNGVLWVGLGTGASTVWSIIYSSDGMNWQAADIGAGIIFNGGGYAAAWNGQMWIAVGTGSNTMAYSYDGIHWTGLGTSTFSTSGNGIAWNGTIWVAVGNGTNFIAYSNDGITWNSISQSLSLIHI